MSVSTEVWLEMFTAAAQHDASIAELCRRYGVSRQSFYLHRQRYEIEGAAGLVSRSRRPHKSPGRTDDEIEAVVVQIRQQNPWMGARAIRSVLIRLGTEVIPAVSTIAQILRRNGLLDIDARGSGAGAVSNVVEANTPGL